MTIYMMTRTQNTFTHIHIYVTFDLSAKNDCPSTRTINKPGVNLYFLLHAYRVCLLKKFASNFKISLGLLLSTYTGNIIVEMLSDFSLQIMMQRFPLV